MSRNQGQTLSVLTTSVDSLSSTTQGTVSPCAVVTVLLLAWLVLEGLRYQN